MSVWSNYDLQYLKENYENMSKYEIANVLGKTPNAIQIKANRLGIKKREKYTYNKNYFNVIDTSTKAYWLGFIYADGYITSNKKETKYSMGIELQKDDYKHLQQFNRDIEGNIQVYFRHRKGHIIEGSRKIKDCDICLIRIYNTKFVKDLMSHGLVKNKSLIKKEPIGVPDEYIRDFIRGYFDGNGSITYSHNKNINKDYLKVSFSCASASFCDWLNNYIINNGFDSTISKDGTAYKIFINGGTNGKCRFLNYMYDNCERYLGRKFDIYSAVCK